MKLREKILLFLLIGSVIFSSVFGSATGPGIHGKAGNITFDGVQSLFPDGTVSAPSIAFSSEPGLGIRRVGADNIAISSSGAASLLDINNNTNVGQIRFRTDGGVEMHWGTKASAQDFMRFGAFNGNNAVDNKARDFRLFSTSVTDGNGFNFNNSTGNVAIGGATANAKLELLGDNARPFSIAKSTVAVVAPGAGVGMLRWEAGTNAGTLKLVAYSGTSTTGVTVVDNVGSGN